MMIGPGADDQDALDVGALAHQRTAAPSATATCERSICCRRRTIRNTKCSNSGRRSCGPGLASGWPWKPKAGRSVRATPCSEPSNSERWVGLSRDGSDRLVDREAVVLAGDQHVAAGKFLHRVVCAVVAELHLDGSRAAREPEQLMAEADAENRNVGIQEFADCGDRVVARLRVAGTVGQEDAVGIERERIRGARLRRHHRHPAAVVGRAAAGCCA